ncbi:hypothetical protein TRFO_24815 [Tritrichomonas foetus]|uniref:Protein kinase domain-containing protein n=1 Tax=Tritrichomonas foetus TaxID=1144522 RepID=A0A1J4K6D0_9EUKA|nr:hypothetical protein TRFO_24815 [Tritrichomonas foetus]|eukprot:OHT07009.1 hypothetical protein TRFO_24815 [Tritrichomonas foetus]
MQESPPLPNRNEIKSTDEAIDPTIRRKSQINSNFIFNTNLNSSQSDKDAQKSDFETYECNLTDFCGSLFYVAPEIVKDIPYNGALVDNWSLGIVLYIMVFGRLPYESQTASEIIEAIKTYHYEMDGMAMVCWPCQDLLSKVLEPNMKKRLSTGDMLKHPWVCPGNTGTVATTHQCLSRTSMKLPSIGNIKTNGVDIQPLNTRTLGDSAMTLAVNKGLLSKRLGKKLVKGPSNPKNKIVIPDVRNHI